jgi:hypothetical protein
MRGRTGILAFILTSFSVFQFLELPALAVQDLQLPWPKGQSHNIIRGNTYDCDTHKATT